MRDNVILVIGACSLDRLLHVPSYPQPDAKVRSTTYHEVGGGNAANTASAIALLSTAAFLSNRNVTVKLLTKIGNDHIGKKVTEELIQTGVDITSPLFRVGGEGKGTTTTTTGLTTVIVSELEHTRTCIHTPGTCGELTIDDLKDIDLDAVFENVVHLHSDARHTDVSLFLAREARKRRIPVAIDVEKDRKTKQLGSLLDEASIVFTNSSQMAKGYFDRLIREYEESSGIQPLQGPVVVMESSNTTGKETFLMSEVNDAQLCERAIRPICYQTRRYRHPVGREVVITNGRRGASHVVCDGNLVEEDNDYSGPSMNEIRISSIGSDRLRVQHKFTEDVDESSCNHSPRKLCSVELSLCEVGVLGEVNVVDTTGAGDAFIGGYIIASIASLGSSFDVESRLRFGSFVGGRKLEGPGARTALPTGADVDEMLGKDVAEIGEKLRKVIGCFQRC